MNNKKQSPKAIEKNQDKILIGKKHEGSRQNSGKENTNENDIRITDNPDEIERKISRIKK